MTSTITNLGEAHDPLDPRVAAELQLLREQLIERLERRISRRGSLRREAGIEAAIAIIGGLAVVISRETQGHVHPAGIVVAILSLSVSFLAALDARRLRSLNMQIQSLASTLASLG
jgi:hypothetical protein